jgi:hypothetical protein
LLERGFGRHAQEIAMGSARIGLNRVVSGVWQVGLDLRAPLPVGGAKFVSKEI